MGLLPLHGGGTEHLQALHPSVHHAHPVHVLNHGKVSYIFKKTIIFFLNFIGKKYPYQYELKAVRPILCFYYHYYHYEKKNTAYCMKNVFREYPFTLLCPLIDPNSGRAWNWIDNTTIVFQGNYYFATITLISSHSAPLKPNISVTPGTRQRWRPTHSARHSS